MLQSGCLVVEVGHPVEEGHPVDVENSSSKGCWPDKECLVDKGGTGTAYVHGKENCSYT